MGPKLNPELPEDGEEEITGETFTRDQINALVRDRLARQRRTLEARYQEQIAAGTEAVKQVEALTAKAVKYDALFKKQLEERCKKLPTSVTMLLDKLDPDEQMTWLDENADKLFFPTPESGPQTPKPTNPAPNAVAVKERKSQSSQYTAM
jgi:hypothetical protein